MALYNPAILYLTYIDVHIKRRKQTIMSRFLLKDICSIGPRQKIVPDYAKLFAYVKCMLQSTTDVGT